MTQASAKENIDGMTHRRDQLLDKLVRIDGVCQDRTDLYISQELMGITRGKVACMES